MSQMGHSRTIPSLHNASAYRANSEVLTCGSARLVATLVGMASALMRGAWARLEAARGILVVRLAAETYSITSFARATITSGIAIPSALAAFKFMMN